MHNYTVPIFSVLHVTNRHIVHRRHHIATASSQYRAGAADIEGYLLQAGKGLNDSAGYASAITKRYVRRNTSDLMRPNDVSLMIQYHVIACGLARLMKRYRLPDSGLI